MRVFAVPHYFGRAPRGTARRHGAHHDQAEQRAAALGRSIHALHSLFGPSQCIMQLARHTTDPANEALRARVQVLVVTDNENHLLDRLELPGSSFQQVISRAAPQHLGFAAHRVLADHAEQAEWLCYLEDDLLIHDSLWFCKLDGFLQHAGAECVLMPHRYETCADAAARRAYVDGDLRDAVTAAFQNIGVAPQIDLPLLGTSIPLCPTANPHSGSFFLRRDQLRQWMLDPEFGRPTEAFIGPLESAATLGVMKHFRVYKAARTHAGFFEIEHQSRQFIRQLRRPS